MKEYRSKADYFVGPRIIGCYSLPKETAKQPRRRTHTRTPRHPEDEVGDTLANTKLINFSS
ncbi:hypothetical protein PAECIP111802_01266 [Paenibacillus allorhizosphaerae]|uniref:Uncharacterized protein n=1 Tax=Paenibacillus allorhizosphaerae TaxID=2849866 RepID=A0ABN7TDY9_9BACL|nr:hypothetical protein PAECIP111802_01266 [Paenibacillus allorhizosphaerae]